MNLASISLILMTFTLVSVLQVGLIAALRQQRFSRDIDYIEVPGSAPIDEVKRCRADEDCSNGYFCSVNASTSKIRNCLKCFDCSTVHRFQGLKKCSKSSKTCGPCLQGFQESPEGLCRYVGCSYRLAIGLGSLAASIIAAVLLTCLYFNCRGQGTDNTAKSDRSSAQGPSSNEDFTSPRLESLGFGSSSRKGKTVADGGPLLEDFETEKEPPKDRPPAGACCKVLLWFLEAF